MAASSSSVKQNEEVMQLLTLSVEENRLMTEIMKGLPTPPEPGYSKQAVLDLMIGPAPEEFREAEWRRIYRVILKTRRLAEQRQPGIPLIVNTGRTSREPRYQLIGFTGPDGSPVVLPGAIQLEHARNRRLADLRTRATSASELLAMKYFVDIVDALDRGDKRRAQELIRMMTRESLFVIPILSLLGQLVGAPYQQARPLSEMIVGLENALLANPKYDKILGKVTARLSTGYKKHWPYIESALAEVVNQLVPAAILVHGSGQIRATLGAAAEAALAERLGADENGGIEEDEE